MPENSEPPIDPTVDQLPLPERVKMIEEEIKVVCNKYKLEIQPAMRLPTEGMEKCKDLQEAIQTLQGHGVTYRLAYKDKQ